MRTLRLISTEKQAALLERLLFGPPAKIRVRALAKSIGTSAAFVSLFLKRLKRAGLVAGGVLVPDEPRVQALRMVFNADKLAGVWPKLKKLGVLGFGVFGSWARGTNSEGSDLDVWVKVKRDLAAEDASRLRLVLKRKTGAPEVSLIILTPQRAGEIKSRDQLFYSTLLNSFIVGGEAVD